MDTTISAGTSIRGVDDSLVDAVPLLPPHCRVLDAGCGAGEEALFLAKMGFDVTAIDAAADAVAHLRDRLEKAGVRVEAFVADIREFVFIRMFGMVNMRFVLHEVPRRVRIPFLERAMAHTEPGGVHTVSVVTGRVSSAGAAAVEPFAAGELAGLYAGWETIVYDSGTRAGGACAAVDRITARKPVLN